MSPDQHLSSACLYANDNYAFGLPCLLLDQASTSIQYKGGYLLLSMLLKEKD